MSTRRTAIVALLLMAHATVIAAQTAVHAASEAATDSLVRGDERMEVKVNRQRSFGSTVPAGNYSGIAPLGDGRYAMVSDKADPDGFYIFRIDIDSLTGKLRHVEHESFAPSGLANRDCEGIAFVPSTGLIYVSGEADNQVLEHRIDGSPTGRRFSLPTVFASATSNYGLESLTYNATTGLFWTTTESTLPVDGRQAAAGDTATRNVLRLQSFDNSLQPGVWHYYTMDPPTATKRPATYAFGVSELCALDDGRLIVLEREFYVSRKKLGSWVNCKLYMVDPRGKTTGAHLPKALLTEFKTRLRLFNMRLANYEGMCLGPRLADGRQVIILVSDSQNQYGGVLKDWFKTIVISN